MYGGHHRTLGYAEDPNVETNCHDEFKAQMVNRIIDRIEEIESLWSQMGVPRSDRRKQLEVHLFDAFGRCISEEQKNLEALANSIMKLEKDNNSLQQELEKPINEKDLYESWPLTNIAQHLHGINESLIEEKKERMVEVDRYRQTDEEICAKLDMPSYPVPRNIIPSNSLMNDLKNHVDEMRDLQEKRLQEYESYQNQIIDLLDKLETEPNNTMERNLVCTKKENAMLSSATIIKMEQIMQSLKRQQEANALKVHQTVERIDVLCTRLKLSDDEREKYSLGSDSVYSSRVVKKISGMVKELEDKKLAHILQFVNEAKKELSSLWDQCLYSDEQRQEFTPMSSNIVNEAVLNDLEGEIERLKSHLAGYGQIYEKIDEWEHLLARKVELDMKEKDPTRLFNRRRNNLAQEETERKRLKIRVPKLEKELFDMVDAHDEDNSQKFCIWGIPLDQYIRDRKNEIGGENDYDKEAKKALKRKQVEHENIYGSIPRRPMTPMNVTTTLSKSKYVDPYLSTANSKFKKSASAEASRQVTVVKSRLPVSQTKNEKNPNLAAFLPKSISTQKKIALGEHQISSHSKRRKVGDNSIISGNLQNTLSSVDSSIPGKVNSFVSSTLTYDGKGSRPGARKHPDPTLTPIASGSKPPAMMIHRTPNKPIFKTPSSTPKFTVGKDKERKPTPNLKSGRRAPFK